MELILVLINKANWLIICLYKYTQRITSFTHASLRESLYNEFYCLQVLHNCDISDSTCDYHNEECSNIRSDINGESH